MIYKFSNKLKNSQNRLLTINHYTFIIKISLRHGNR